MSIAWNPSIHSVSPHQVPRDAMVLFYRDGCGWCHRVAPEYNALPAELARAGLDTSVVVVDGAQHAGAINVRGFPTIRYVDQHGEEHEFEGERTAKNFAAFIAAHRGGMHGGGHVKRVPMVCVPSKLATRRQLQRSLAKVKPTKKSPRKRAIKGGGMEADDYSDDEYMYSDAEAEELEGGGKPKAKAKPKPKSKAKGRGSLKSKAKAKSKAKRPLHGGDCYVEGGYAEYESDDEDFEGGGKKKRPAHRSPRSAHRKPRSRSAHRKPRSRSAHRKPRSRSAHRKPRSRSRSATRKPSTQNVALALAYAQIKKMPEYCAFVAAERRAGRNGLVRIGEGRLGRELARLVNAQRAKLQAKSPNRLDSLLTSFQVSSQMLKASPRRRRSPCPKSPFRARRSVSPKRR